MKHNMKRHELAGIMLIFIGGTSVGISLYNILWSAFNSRALIIKDMIFFPVLFAIGLLLYEFGMIELKEVPPGKKRHN